MLRLGRLGWDAAWACRAGASPANKNGMMHKMTERIDDLPESVVDIS
jgi:hypothetical protein